ncbi:MAG: hypothetical protein KC591_14140 [Gemmatimonadetes bacterium]|nr:hypothetical protein [Gemmatimonadota bacterium]
MADRCAYIPREQTEPYPTCRNPATTEIRFGGTKHRPDAVILVCSRCAAQYREDEAARLAEENPPAAEEEIG